jgi:hypothetical protein
MGLIAGALTLFSGISKVKDLFTKGKELIEDVRGVPSTASTPEELESEFMDLPLEKQQIWVDKMASATAQYEAETGRLRAEQEISPEIAAKVDPETASKIAYQRQTTRPWAVRQMIYLIMAPFYLIGLDVIQHLIKNWLLFWTDKVKPFESFTYVFGTTGDSLVDKVGSLIGPMPKTMAAQMYIEAISVAVWVVVTYMGLREAGKYRDKQKGDGIIGKIKDTGIFSKILGGK